MESSVTNGGIRSENELFLGAVLRDMASQCGVDGALLELFAQSRVWEDASGC